MWLAILAGHTAVFAHSPDTSYAQVKLSDGQVAVRLTYDLFTLEKITKIDTDGDGKITRDELRKATPAIEKFLRAHVQLELNGGITDLGRLGELGWPSGQGDAIVENDWNSADGLIHFPFTKDVIETPQTAALAFDLFNYLGSQHTVLGTFAYDGQPLEVSFTQTEPDYLFDTGFVPSLGSRLVRFLELGVKHIFLGYDHLCFLLALIVVSRFRELVKIVTAFTIAHTLTLILTATQVVTLPVRFVEAAIALTIIYVALENLWIKSTNKRWRLAFLFGLVHGFGFATLLQQLGLPPSGLIRPLVSFNVGVEIAQLGIVLALLPVSVWLARWRHGASVRNAVSVVIFLLGLAWFSIRAFNLKIPGFI
ncbi:MAG TPA: HupE/UreJ family protein [Verrucomicrobiae bacterium]|nr:HupE/UreJ family protein [Verrucomicrobiae bacterium]